MSETDFFEACKRGDLLLVEQLLQDAGIEASARQNEAICWAAMSGHLAVVERLLQDKRVDPAACNNDAIRKAIALDRCATVDRLYQDVRVYAVLSQSSSSQVSFPHLSMFKSRMLQVCIALQSLDLPALLTLKIIDKLILNTVTMYAKWKLITTVKHFHQRNV